MVQPHLRALLFLADDAQEGGGGGPELNLSTSVKLELFRAVLETSGHALAWLLTKAVGGRFSGQAGLTLMRYPTMEHHLSEEFM